MMTACEVTETAVRLRLHLQTHLIPEDFHLPGEYQQIMTSREVDEYTNYETLQRTCPAARECPIAAGAGEQPGAACFNYNLARDILQTEAREHALVMFALCQPWPQPWTQGTDGRPGHSLTVKRDGRQSHDTGL